MDEKMLLDAIGKMLDERDQRMSDMMDAKLEPIKQDLADVKQRTTKIEFTLEQDFVAIFKFAPLDKASIL